MRRNDPRLGIIRVLRMEDQWIARDRLRRGESIFGGFSVHSTYEEAPKEPKSDGNGAWQAKEVPPPPNALDAAYLLLGLTKPTTVADVKSAYKRLAFETHPDRGGSAVKFTEATEARDRILKELKTSSP